MSAVRETKSVIYRDMANESYHASPGISNSGLGDLEKSPAHYYAWHLDPNRPPRPEKAGQLEGNLAHCAVLEPDEFDKRYIVGPDVNRNTKVWKEFVAEHSDKTAIKPAQYETAMRQRDSVWSLPDIRDALSKGMAEVSAFWDDPETGVLCRCRPDFVHEAGSGVVLIDLKTYSSAAPSEFRLQAARKRYHRQDAYYTDGYGVASGQKVLAFIFVAVETEWPYAACASMLDDASRQAGRALYQTGLRLYADCMARNEWPSYSQAIELISLPAYALGDDR